MGDMVRN